MRSSLVYPRGAAAAAAIVSLFLTGAGAAHAGAPASTAESRASSEEALQRRIEELEEDVRELRRDSRKLKVAEEARQKVKPVAGWQDGLFLASPDGAHKLEIGGYVHTDARFFVGGDDAAGTDQFTFRRVRPSLEGTLFKNFDFRVLPDFAGGRVVLQDAWLTAKHLPYAKLTVGKFKTPFGIERLQSANAIPFIERSIANNLVPNRDLGLQLGGDVRRGVVSYAFGVFDGVADGASNNSDIDLNDSKDVAARIFVQPFLETTVVPLRGLGLGVAGTYGRQNGTLATPDVPTYRTSGQSTFFRFRTDTPATAAGTTIANGDRFRYSPQTYYYWRQLGVLADYVATSERVRRGDVSERLENDAWQVTGSFVLTGEDNSYKGITPLHPFEPTAGEWGAFEVAARFSHVDIDNESFSAGFADPTRAASSADAWSLGANWVLNKAIRVMLDYERTSFQGGAADGDLEDEHLLATRVQLVL